MIVEIILISFATASLSYTITETKLFKPLREWLKMKNAFLGKLFTCGYCFAHWIALLLVVVLQVRIFNTWWLLDYILTVLVIAWLSGFQWALMCWLMEKAGK